MGRGWPAAAPAGAAGEAGEQVRGVCLQTDHEMGWVRMAHTLPAFSVVWTQKRRQRSSRDRRAKIVRRQRFMDFSSVSSGFSFFILSDAGTGKKFRTEAYKSLVFLYIIIIQAFPPSGKQSLSKKPCIFFRAMIQYLPLTAWDYSSVG